MSLSASERGNQHCGAILSQAVWGVKSPRQVPVGGFLPSRPRDWRHPDGWGFVLPLQLHPIHKFREDSCGAALSLQFSFSTCF